VTKKKCFDRATMSHSGKETWSFNFSGPYLYDSSMRLVGDRTVLDQNFFQKEKQVFLFEGGRFNRKLLLSFIAQIQNKPVPSCEKSVQWLVTAAMCCMWWQGVLIGLFTFVPL